MFIIRYWHFELRGLCKEIFFQLKKPFGFVSFEFGLQHQKLFLDASPQKHATCHMHYFYVLEAAFLLISLYFSGISLFWLTRSINFYLLSHSSL
jgi:hypothetical protein